MLARLLSMTVLAAGAVLCATGPASAADLGEGYYAPQDRYDEPRYAQSYRVPAPRDDAREYPAPRDDARGRDDARDYDARDYDARDYADDENAPPPRVGRYEPAPYGEGPPLRYADRGRDDGCVPRWQIRNRLLRDGWIDLQPLERSPGDVATIRARRGETGRVFLLSVDRCSGEIIHARRDALRSFGAYTPPWRRGPY